MTDAPERIWALCDRRKHWQDEPPRDGQHAWHWTEYIRADLASDIRNQALEEAAQNILTAIDRAKAQGTPHKLSPSMALYLSSLRAALTTIKGEE